MNVILFGPPGVGKSTLIEYFNTIILKNRIPDLIAFDLETLRVRKGTTLDNLRVSEVAMLYQLVGYNKAKFGRFHQHMDYVIGGAALDPKLDYPGFKKVFLNMPQAEYEVRRTARDKNYPQKALQSKHVIADWLKGAHYDYIVMADTTVEGVAIQIGRILSRKK